MALFTVILVSWGLAFFEYLFQVPSNRAGFKEDGGPFTLVQLKTIQEAITLIVFMTFTMIFFREEKLAWNHLVGFVFLVAAVFFIFKEWLKNYFHTSILPYLPLTLHSCKSLRFLGT